MTITAPAGRRTSAGSAGPVDLAGLGLEALPVGGPADGGPGRHTRLALWSPTGAELAAVGWAGEVTVVVPASSGLEARTVPARMVELGAVLDDLVALPADVDATPSVRAWAATARLAVHLVARGRIRPAVSPSGHDTWTLGPHDPDDARRWHQLAAALPPTAHCLAEPRPCDAPGVGAAGPSSRASAGVSRGGQPGAAGLLVTDPERLVRRFADAVADTVVRTAALPLAAGHAAYTAPGSVTGEGPAGEGGGWTVDRVVAVRAWTQNAAGAATRTTVILRLVPPDAEDQPFVAELVIQSPDDPSLVLTAAELWTSPDTVLARFADAEETVLVALRRARAVWPPVGRLLDQARPERLVLDDDEVDDLLGPVVERLGAAGIHVQWPADLFRSLELRPTLDSAPTSTPTVQSALRSGLDLPALLTWRARIDGAELTDDELETLASAKRGVVRLRGRWVRADPDRLARLATIERVSGVRALAAALGAPLQLGPGWAGDADPSDLPFDPLDPGASDWVGTGSVEVTGPLADLADRLRRIGRPHSRPAPPGLSATLRPYQERGLAWMADLVELGLGGILADDMGLGKTLQVLALHVAVHCDIEPPRGPTLVVAPSTLMANWEREAARFAPGIPVRRYHGTGRHLDDLAPDELVLTTYGVVRLDVDELRGGGDGPSGAGSPRWGLCVADEAQAVKNPHSATARALRSIPASARIALSGTPVENQLSELWAISQFAVPGLLGSLEAFRRDLAVPIERDGDETATDRLATLLRPFLLRRRKSDPGIAPDLPPKTETDHLVGLTAEQATLYRAVVDQSLDEITESEGMARRGLVLSLLTALKQICNHPAQHLGQDGPLSGRSAKLAAVTDLIEIVRAEGEQVLVFTQYVAMGGLLSRHLAAGGHRVGFLHGSLSLTARQELVDRFQAGDVDVFVISLKAGGTGLNLTAATHVIHYDRWWNPAVEDQASDRAWRIGQDRPVQIHRMVCEGTVEERIAAMLATKRDLADRVVGSGEGWLGDLDDAALAELVALAPGSG